MCFNRTRACARRLTLDWVQYNVDIGAHLKVLQSCDLCNFSLSVVQLCRTRTTKELLQERDLEIARGLASEVATFLGVTLFDALTMEQAHL